MRHWVVVSMISSAAFADVPKQHGNPDLARIPVDVELVAGLHFGRLQSSALWKQYVEPVFEGTAMRKRTAKVKAACGVDPLAGVTNITFGMRHVGDTSYDVTFVIHGVPRAKVLACLATPGVAKEIEVGRDGDVFVSSPGGVRTAAFTFVDDATVVGVAGANASTEAVHKAVTGGSALPTAAQFVDMFERTNTADTLWLLANGNSKLFEPLATTGTRPKALFGSLNVSSDVSSSDVSIAARLRMDSPDTAARIAVSMNAQLGPVSAMFDRLAVGYDGVDITLSLAASGHKLEALGKIIAAKIAP